MDADQRKLLPINEIAAGLGLTEDDLDPYGRYTAKIKLSVLPAPDASPRGKLVLVTATTPTSHGEGKTVVSIGLAQALEKLGKRAIVTLREPSLGPVFGVKGGAAGGGRSQVLPSEKINLHFTGDLHAVTSAHNLLAAMIDSHLYHGNPLRLDLHNIFWPRAVDMNDRALRHVIVGLGTKTDGVPRETGFVITAASEIMAILALAISRDDCQRRLSAMTVAFDADGQPVCAADLQAVGAMMVLLNDALMPNLVQTSERTAALVHAGPFANIAHGTSSVMAQRMALGLAQYVINETGFGAELGVEKFMDIVMPSSGMKPSAAVLVTTVRGLREQGQRQASSEEALKNGLDNLAKHADNLRKFGLPTVVAINLHPGDKDDEIRWVKAFCADLGIDAATANVYAEGGNGGLEVAGKVIQVVEKADSSKIKPMVAPELPLAEKIQIIAREIYGADGVYFQPPARRKLDKFTALGYASLPVCIAKTQASLSDDPKRLGVPKGWTFTAADAHLASGAGFVVVTGGNMTLMPGLSKTPQAANMRVDQDGTIHGLS